MPKASPFGFLWFCFLKLSPLTFQLGPRPEDQGEGGHQEALSALPVADPRQAGLQGTQAAATHTARERKNTPPPPDAHPSTDLLARVNSEIDAEQTSHSQAGGENAGVTRVAGALMVPVFSVNRNTRRAPGVVE